MACSHWDSSYHLGDGNLLHARDYCTDGPQPAAGFRIDWRGDDWQPFLNLRLFGGIIGGVVAGYLTANRWTLNAVNGVLAAIYGLVGVYLLLVSYNTIHSVIMTETIPPPLFTIVFLPLVYFLPFTAVYLVGGLIGGVIGGIVAN